MTKTATTPAAAKAERDKQPVEPRFKAKAGDTTAKSKSTSKAKPAAVKSGTESKPAAKPKSAPTTKTPAKTATKPKSAPTKREVVDVPTGSVRFSVPGAAHAVLVADGSSTTKSTLAAATKSERAKGASFVVVCTIAKAKSVAADARKHVAWAEALGKGKRGQAVRISQRACSQLADKIDDVLAS